MCIRDSARRVRARIAARARARTASTFENHPGMRANALFWSLGTTASTANCARSNAGASPRESVFKVDIARARRRRRRNVRFVDAVALVQVFFSFFENKTSTTRDDWCPTEIVSSGSLRCRCRPRRRCRWMRISARRRRGCRRLRRLGRGKRARSRTRLDIPQSTLAGCVR